MPRDTQCACVCVNHDHINPNLFGSLTLYRQAGGSGSTFTPEPTKTVTNESLLKSSVEPTLHSCSSASQALSIHLKANAREFKTDSSCEHGSKCAPLHRPKEVCCVILPGALSIDPQGGFSQVPQFCSIA